MIAPLSSPIVGDRLLRRIDILRHELKALRFILDGFHAGSLTGTQLPPRDDFQSDATRAIYDAILDSASRADAEAAIVALDLDDVDIDSFLRLSGAHYYTYPMLVSARAEAIRAGKVRVEPD